MSRTAILDSEWKSRILSAIGAANDDGVSLTAITRQTAVLSNARRNAMLGELTATGSVTVGKSSGGRGRPSIRYRLANIPAGQANENTTAHDGSGDVNEASGGALEGLESEAA